MRQITYHQRVKNVLQRIAQNDVQYISFDDFLDRVGDSQLLDTGRKGSRLKQYVSKSIARECRAGRIRVEGLCNSNRKLVFTAQGMRYFQRYALHTLHDENSREFQRLTVRKLRNDTKALNDRLHEIREILTNGQADQTRTIVYFEDIPSAIQTRQGRYDISTIHPHQQVKALEMGRVLTEGAEFVMRSVCLDLTGHRVTLPRRRNGHGTLAERQLSLEGTKIWKAPVVNTPDPAGTC
ncbi:hypothetical protein NUW54_g3560 [Trametes sanguinea]|uniref:Uncharacterized protein n=1 Tax=Trametes sanguinea TaxID=158606 RepID=A0ACC1Q0N7_9APHY|nr:hypothetical protein NUW54_g3560 [Trametes sanguinea]